MRGQVGNRVQEIVGEEIVGVENINLTEAETAVKEGVEIAIKEEGAETAVTEIVTGLLTEEERADTAKDLQHPLAVEMMPVDDLATRLCRKQRRLVCFPRPRLTLPKAHL
jgi:hypothetical protein